jgi:hypothetical protein
MKYRVVFKRISMLTKTAELVEAQIEATGASVLDGCLIFDNEDTLTPGLILPPGFWFLAEAEIQQPASLGLPDSLIHIP